MSEYVASNKGAGLGLAEWPESVRNLRSKAEEEIQGTYTFYKLGAPPPSLKELEEFFKAEAPQEYADKPELIAQFYKDELTRMMEVVNEPVDSWFTDYVWTTNRADLDAYKNFNIEMRKQIDLHYGLIKAPVAETNADGTPKKTTGTTTTGGSTADVSTGSTTAKSVWNTVANGGSYLAENLVEYIDPEGGDRDFKGGFGMVGDVAGSIYDSFKDATDPSRGPLARWGGKLTYGIGAYVGLSFITKFIPGVGDGFIGQAISIAGALMVMAISNNEKRDPSKATVQKENGAEDFRPTSVKSERTAVQEGNNAPYVWTDAENNKDKTNGVSKITVEKTGALQVLNEDGKPVDVTLKITDEKERLGFIEKLKKGAVKLTGDILNIGGMDYDLTPA